MSSAPCNQAVYTFDEASKKWKFLSRHALVLDAAKEAGLFHWGCVIDLVTGRVVWRPCEFCNRKRPESIKDLEPVETLVIPASFVRGLKECKEGKTVDLDVALAQPPPNT